MSFVFGVLVSKSLTLLALSYANVHDGFLQYFRFSHSVVLGL